MRGSPRACTVDEVVSRINSGMTQQQVARALGISQATVWKRLTEANAAGIDYARKHRRVKGELRANRRNADTVIVPLTDRAATGMPAVNHPALSEKRAMFPTSVTPIDGLANALISGVNSRKIGSHIVKGMWKGFPIYTLTLEERATCPTSCTLWRSCYGNAMPFAKRLRHGPGLEKRLWHELAVMQSRHPKGFAVRLHVLGDFYSIEYVRLWREWLNRLPALHVFGFTARHDFDDPIAVVLRDLVQEQWPRFAIRFSNAPRFTGVSTVTIEHPLQKPVDAIICPQQLGKTESCGTCGLCWHTTKRIAFLRH